MYGIRTHPCFMVSQPGFRIEQYHLETRTESHVESFVLLLLSRSSMNLDVSLPFFLLLRATQH